MNTINLKVAAKMNGLSIPNKMNRAKHIVNTMTANAPAFPNPTPALATVSGAINALETAWNDAADGGKTKKKIMRDKEDALMKLMNDLAAYVERIANGSSQVVTLSGFDVKKAASRTAEDFSVTHAGETGAVKLRVKSRAKPKTVYRWEYCKDPAEPGQWKVHSCTARAAVKISGLGEGVKYWFRVFYLGDGNDHLAFPAQSLIVV